MKIRLAILGILALAALSCSDSDITVNVDLISFLGPAEINYTSPTFNAPGGTPLDQDLPTGLGFESELTRPVTVNLLQGGADITDIQSSHLTFKMRLEPHNFSGLGTVTMVIGNNEFFRNEGLYVSLTVTADRQILPATFDLSSSDPRLNRIFESDDVYVTYRVRIEAARLSDPEIFVSGTVEEFTTVLTGKQGIL
ncbi:MAG: hypothetical protein U9P14_06165 [Gemmatimonadota bacterium]|nr:hypothetical protein [Gemmatimonadota bacterium]